MDPVSALGFASSVVQLIHFGFSLGSQVKRIYYSADGALPEHIECEESGNRLKELSDKIKESIGVMRTSSNPLAQAENKALEDICNGCIKVLDELQQLL